MTAIASSPGLRIGIDMGGTKIEAIVLRDDGVVTEHVRIATPHNDYAGCVDAVAGIVEQFDAKVGARCAVGIGTPGAWRDDVEAMHNCNSTWLNGRALLTDLRERLGLRVRMANDANCLALSEALDGAANGARCVFAVILGTGVGGGIVFDGSLLVGRNAIAGEWGHTALPLFHHDSHLPAELAESEQRLTHRFCYCGRLDCIETFLSGPGLSQTHYELSGEKLDAARIAPGLGAARAHSLDLYLHMLARSLAQIVNVLDPDVFVIGGGVSQVKSIYERVPALWHPHVFSDIVTTSIVAARHGAASGVRGAARLWPADYTLDAL